MDRKWILNLTSPLLRNNKIAWTYIFLGAGIPLMKFAVGYYNRHRLDDKIVISRFGSILRS